MVIREILDGFDKEIKASKAATARLQEMKDRVLSCCRAAETGPVAGSIGCPEIAAVPRKKKAA